MFWTHDRAVANALKQEFLKSGELKHRVNTQGKAVAPGTGGSQLLKTA